MEFRNTEESKETGKRTEETKVEVDRPYFSEPEESDYKGVHTQIKEGLWCMSFYFVMITSLAMRSY